MAGVPDFSDTQNPLKSSCFMVEMNGPRARPSVSIHKKGVLFGTLIIFFATFWRVDPEIPGIRGSHTTAADVAPATEAEQSV